MDMYTHLSLWINILTTKLGRPLEDDDNIFPFIRSNGIINPTQPIKHDAVQDLFDEFVKSTGIDKLFTTHCLQRGGAQYRLADAPIGKRWSISRIRWWGGWADGEKVDVLMKYLIDSLINLEDGHQDALNPTEIDKSKHYLGEDELTKPMTRGDVHYIKESIISAVQTTVEMVIQSSTPPGLGAAASNIRYPPTTAMSSCADGSTARVSANLEVVSGPGGYDLPAIYQQLTPALETLNLKETCPCARQQTRKERLPTPGVNIPNIGRSRDSWREAVRQWEEGDPSKNMRALKDWPASWYTGVMRPFTGVKRQSRRLIAEEYER